MTLYMSSPQHHIDAFLDSQADAALDRYLDGIEDGLPRREKEEPFYYDEE